MSGSLSRCGPAIATKPVIIITMECYGILSDELVFDWDRLSAIALKLSSPA
ncbi:MAG: hypothetical protein AAGD25_17585 [Cyanobacteria bacterium P01_F01_bin.150]